MASYGASQLASGFRTVRKNTIQVAHDIPEAQYDFVAAPGVQSVGQMLRHIAFAPYMYEQMHGVEKITTLAGYDFGAIIGRMAALEAPALTKAETISVLESEGERFAEWLESLSEAQLAEEFTDPMGKNPRSRLDHLTGAKEHEMHHRAQLMLIERVLGIVPHLTRQREERRQAMMAAAKPAAAASATA